MKKFFILITVFTMCLSFTNVTADTTYSISLSAPEYVFFGQEIEVDILIDTGGNEISCAGFYLTYNPTLFEFVNFKKENRLPDNIINITKAGEGTLCCFSINDNLSYENEVWATVTFRATSNTITSAQFCCISGYDDELLFMDKACSIIPDENIVFESDKMHYNCHHSSGIVSFVYYKDSTVIHVAPSSEHIGKKFFITFYKDNELSDMKVWTCSDTYKSFVSYAFYNKIKIMIQQNTASVFPVYCHETIE